MRIPRTIQNEPQAAVAGARINVPANETQVSKLAAAELKSQEKNIEIQTKIVKQTQVIKERGEDIIKYIDREVVKYDNICPVPKEVIKALNDAAGVPNK